MTSRIPQSGDRKKQILEHLKNSSELNLISSPKKTKSTPVETSPLPEISPPVTENPAPSAETSVPPTSKKDVMTHLNRSSANFGSFNLSSESRKKQIEEHIRKSIN
jgi:hypothetical protein